jgi:hypothetical protein
MRDSNVVNAAKESTQIEFLHGLQDFCTGCQSKIEKLVAQFGKYGLGRWSTTMQTLQIHDYLRSELSVVDPRAVFAMLGERAVHASWQVAGVARYDEACMITGDEAADRLEALSQSQDRVSGALLSQFFLQIAQVIWGEFTAYEGEEVTPWVTTRAIDSSWCEVETDDAEVLNCVRRIFVDVRTAP